MKCEVREQSSERSDEEAHAMSSSEELSKPPYPGQFKAIHMNQRFGKSISEIQPQARALRFL